MKIAGKVPGLKIDTFKLVRGEDVFPIRFRAMPIGLYEMVEKALGGPPRAPIKGFIKDGHGGFLRDENNRPVQDINESDPAYREATAAHGWLLNAAMIYHCVDDPDVTFATEDPGDDKRSRAFYEAVLEEMREAGFSAGDIGNMVQFVSSLSEITPERIKETKESF